MAFGDARICPGKSGDSLRDPFADRLSFQIGDVKVKMRRYALCNGNLTWPFLAKIVFLLICRLQALAITFPGE